ncbi:sugar ABC transporter permease [Demequina sp.]|uniref:carbohydrate ABC transporter permease n=1 Tax=Demequina sp. TaxID=2050685 RepID=UPI0025BAFC38|nr:sugar ABC transporter permease [Demequina sp.]
MAADADGVVQGRRDETPTRVSSRRPGAARRVRRPRWIGFAYLAPAGTLYLLFVLVPGMHTLWLSLFRWDGVTVGTWAGVDNYRAVAENPLLRGAVVHAFVLVVFFSGFSIAVGLLMAAILGRHRRRGMTFYRVVFFLPQVVPMVAVGITWRWMYTENGAVNQILRAVGLDSITQAWLGNFTLALPAVGLIGTWALSGLCFVLFLSGAQKIDNSLYEAARMDGAGAVREFFAVTLPALRGEIAVALTITVVAALASFDIVYVTTNGSPGNTTTVPGLLVYRLAFTDGQVGVASALAVTLTALIVTIVLFIQRLTRETK